MRYLKLYLSFMRFAFSRTLQFRVSFFFRVMMDLCYASMIFFFYSVLFDHVPTIGGWSKEQAYIFLSLSVLLDAIYMTLLSDGMNHFSEVINKGELDYHLVRPVSPLFMATGRDISLNSLLNVVFSLCLLAYCLQKATHSFSLTSYALLIIASILGLTIQYCLRLLFILPTFWLGQARGIEMLYWNFNLVTDRPDPIFSGAARVILTTIIPFCLIASFPAQVFFAENPFYYFAHLAAVAVGLVILTHWLWKRALRSYSSASS